MALFADGMTLLTGGLKTAAGAVVTYARGSTTASVTAWVGRTLFAREPQEPGGAAVVWGDRDYLIAVADISAFGVPQKGDRITQTISGTSVVFEVVTPDTNEPAWRYSDQTRTIYRVHTKRVA